jgi:hypothetical protein
MIGGQGRKTSWVALAAITGMFAGGMSAAQAADLGGDCCADLEERVAELEATTARKGNRKVSLTISGQVHRIITYWNDGGRSGTYIGLDGTTSSSRFSFTGEARLAPTWKAGFDITIEIEAGGTSSKASQFDEDGKLAPGLAAVVSPTGGNASFNGVGRDAYFGDARRAAIWLEQAQIGRFTLGRWESAGAVTTIDLAGIGIAASSSGVLLNGSFFVRDPAGVLRPITWGALGDPASVQGRVELLRWDSPSLAGFVLSASIGEAGDYWGAMLRYAGEFSGFRIAAGIGYEKSTDKATPDILALSTLTEATWLAAKPSIGSWAGALSILHAPTGLFLQGHYLRQFNNNQFGSDYYGYNAGNNSGAAAFLKPDATNWLIQGGIAQNFFGVGRTSLYGEYGKWEDFGAGEGAGRTYSNAGAPTLLGPTLAGVVGTDMRIWGLGIVQAFDAAAMELYLSYRNHKADITTATPANGFSSDFDQVTGGARIRF